MALREVNQEVYKKDWQWQEGEYTVTRTCQWSGPGCHDGCGVLFYTKDNKLVKVEGDPNSSYFNGRLCMRCLDLVEAVNHPDRIIYPQKRVGERGENKWERISWDEALATIKERYDSITEHYGTQSVITMCGTGRNSSWQVGSISSTVFGSPSGSSGFLSGEACYAPRIMAMGASIGSSSVIDCAQMYPEQYDHPEWKAPEVIIVWGCDPLKSNADGFIGHWIVDLMKQGSKLIVIDPNLIWLAAKAEVFLPVRPGTDAVLAMALINTVIQEGFYDEDFVDKWCYGFEELAKRVKEWTPERASEVCWVPAERILTAARLFGNARVGSIHWGVAIDQCTHGVTTALAIADLWSICGYVDVPGGNILMNVGHYQNDFGFAMSQMALPSAVFDEKTTEILKQSNYKLRTQSQMGPPSDVYLECLESEYPFPMKMAFIMNTNTVSNMSAEATRCFEAMKSLEFCVVAELFPTPTVVAFADIVLPLAMSCERNSVRAWWAPMRAITKVIQTGECKGDEEILLTLGKLFNPEKFPFKDEVEFLDYLMANVPPENQIFTFEQLKTSVGVFEPWHYRKYETGLLRTDGQPGFNTVTGRIELFATLFERCGLDPLPYYAEPSEGPVTTPDDMRDYPFVLTTGHRSYEFFHSEHRQLKAMREFHPWPLVEINSADAEPLGIVDGDWVWIQNKHGKCKQKALVTPAIRPGVINAEHGWWFPEREASAPTLFGVFESNINNLTTMCDIGPTGFGAPYKTQICKVSKVTSENEQYVMTPEEIALSKESRRYISSKHLHEKVEEG
jgi:anaerobic selenocysteine-containing dehydrogenase